jgi:peptide chain release factor 1
MPDISDRLKDDLRAKLAQLVAQHQAVEAQLSDPDIVADHNRLARVAREHGQLAKFVTLSKELATALQAAADATEMIEESGDEPEMAELAREELEEAHLRESATYESLIELLVTDEEEDSRSVIMELRPGTGGDEAALFALDLFRMYARYAEARRWKVEEIDSQLTELGGIRELTVAIEGKGAWQKLRYESGGHRVQRVPETESQGRIHTSLATVAVLPKVQDVDIHIDPSDVEMTFMRSSGPGGQHVNKTSSCVRLVHKPSGITVKCQDQKSQLKNRKKAMEILRARLYALRDAERHEARDSLRKNAIGSGDRSVRIRTYNYPQDRITDHRIGLDIFGIPSFLAGDCDRMFDALAAHDREERIRDFSR